MYTTYINVDILHNFKLSTVSYVFFVYMIKIKAHMHTIKNTVKRMMHTNVTFFSNNLGPLKTGL